MLGKILMQYAVVAPLYELICFDALFSRHFSNVTLLLLLLI